MGEPEVITRRAKARDMAFIAELWTAFSEEMAKVDERYSLRETADIIWAQWAGKRLKDEASIALVAESGDECVGYLIAHTEDAHPIFEHRRYGRITDIFVKPDFRRKGIGTRLGEEALAFFKARGVEHIRMNLLVQNASARAFLEKQGFGDFLHCMWNSL